MSTFAQPDDGPMTYGAVFRAFAAAHPGHAATFRAVATPRGPDVAATPAAWRAFAAWVADRAGAGPDEAAARSAYRIALSPSDN